MTDPGWMISSRSFLRPIVMPPSDLVLVFWGGGSKVSQPVRRVLALPVFTSRISACILSRHHLNLPPVRLVQQNVGMPPEAFNTYKWGCLT